MKWLIFFSLSVTTCMGLHLQRFSTSCGASDKKGTVNFIDVGGCHAEPCIIRPGSTYSIHVNFTATKPITEAHNKLYGTIAGLDVPFPVTPENNCGHSLACPVSTGSTAVFELSLTCPTFAPQIKLSAKWLLKDVGGEEIMCFVIPLEIRA